VHIELLTIDSILISWHLETPEDRAGFELDFVLSIAARRGLVSLSFPLQASLQRNHTTCIFANI
jgi:hypothetical protein